jgi:hypothetical protein
LLLEAADQFLQRHPYRSADLAEFDQVQPPLPRLVLGDEGLRLVQECRQLVLTETCPQAELAEELLKDFLLGGEDALLHATSR